MFADDNFKFDENGRFFNAMPAQTKAQPLNPINTIYAVTSRQKKKKNIYIYIYIYGRHALSPPSCKRFTHSLGRYTVVMCTMGVSSSRCGRLEAIELVGVSNIAVLATGTSTMWSIFRTPCCLKTLPKLSNSTTRTSSIHGNRIYRHTSIKHASGTFG